MHDSDENSHDSDDSRSHDVTVLDSDEGDSTARRYDETSMRCAARLPSSNAAPRSRKAPVPFRL